MTNLNLFDPTRPQEGAAISGLEMRDLLNSIATMNAGIVPPGGDAILIGDTRFTSISTSSVYTLDITINGVNKVVDIQESNSLATPTSIAAKINTEFLSLGTVAYVYNSESFDSSASIVLIAPRVSGGTASITISEGDPATDATLNVFGVQGRGKGMPYTVTAANVPYGTSWLKSLNGDDDEVSLYMGSPARATGLLDLSDGTGTVNLSAFTSLRIRILGPSVVFGPLTIDIRGASVGATTPEEIVAAINTAFLAEVGWASPTYGPAKLIARNGGGKYLQIVSGPTDAPYTGPAAAVELSGLAVGGTLGVNFLIDDAITLVMGFSRGEAGKIFTRVPHVFKGTDFTSNFIRGIGNRSGAGIGMWGPALESSIDIPTAGAMDGENRMAKDTGIPWIYREGQNGLSGSGWRRAIPGYEYPVAYNKATEQYRLLSTTDTFVPQPLSRLSHDIGLPWPSTVIDANNKLTGKVGDALALVDGRDFLWKDPVSGGYTDNRNPYDTPAIWDNFPTARYQLGRTREGVRWFISDPNSPAITGVNDQRLRPVGSNTARTDATNGFTTGPVRAYLDGAGVSRFYDLTATGSGPVAFTVPGVSVNAPIKAKSFSIRFIGATSADPSVLNTTGTIESYRGYDNGSGTISGTGFSGTIDYNTGAVTNLTFGTSVTHTSYRLAYHYCQSDLNVVAVDVRKDPSFEVKAGGTVAEAGVIYSAIGTGSGNIDFGSGFSVVVRDDGTASIYSLAGGTPTLVTGGGFPGHFIIDPPLDTTWRTLRVMYATDGSNMIHSVFWNGSNKPCDWVTKDYSAPLDNLTASQTNGGTEIDRQSKVAVVATVPFNGDPNVVGYYNGLWARGVAAAGGYTEKVVAFKNFQSHGGHLRSFLEPIPALPPVSAIRLRDTINAVQLLHNDVWQAGRIITDCTSENPLSINLTGDLANVNSAISADGVGGSTGRKLSISLDVPGVLKTRDPRYLYTPATISGNPGYLGIYSGGTDLANLNGRVAYWSMSDVLFTNPGTPGQGRPALLYIRSDVANLNTGSPPYFNQASSVQTTYSAPGGPISLGGTGDTEVGAWNPGNAGQDRTILIQTYLPNSGHNSINWIYRVQRSEVIVEHSSRLLSAGFPTASPNWTPGAPYAQPAITKVYRDPALNPSGQAFVTLTVTFTYRGPVRPTGFYLDVMATRVGTTT